MSVSEFAGILNRYVATYPAGVGMKNKMTSLGYLGLIAGLAGLIWYLNVGPGAPRVNAQGTKGFKATEQIGVEQAVDFPIDI